MSNQQFHIILPGSEDLGGMTAFHVHMLTLNIVKGGGLNIHFQYMYTGPQRILMTYASI